MTGATPLTDAEAFADPDLVCDQCVDADFARQLERECARLRLLVQLGERVVEDFMPNIGHCVLRDYGALNEFLLGARLVGIYIDEQKAMKTNFYFWAAGWKYLDCLYGTIAEATERAKTLAKDVEWPVVVSDEGPDPDHDDLVQTYRKGPAPVSVWADGRIIGESCT
jgi:hypothetical protein